MHMPTPRPVVHLELHTADQARASAFYTKLLCWRTELIKAGSGSYLAPELGGGLGGGIEHARRLGASVLLEPREGPAGWRSVVSTLEGGQIAFWQPKR